MDWTGWTGQKIGLKIYAPFVKENFCHTSLTNHVRCNIYDSLGILSGWWLYNRLCFPYCNVVSLSPLLSFYPSVFYFNIFLTLFFSIIFYIPPPFVDLCLLSNPLFSFSLLKYYWSFLKYIFNLLSAFLRLFFMWKRYLLCKYMILYGWWKLNDELWKQGNSLHEMQAKGAICTSKNK